MRRLRPKPAVQPLALDETWPSRARREAQARVLNAPFLLAEMFGGAVIAVASRNAVWVLIYLVLLLAFVVSWALVATPAFQRDEARTALSALTQDATGSAALIAVLRDAMKYGDTLLEEFHDSSYSPLATGEVLPEPINDALQWAERVEQHLSHGAPEWIPDFRDAGYAIPSEVYIEEITIDDATALIADKVRVLGRIVRDLHGRGGDQ